MSNVRSREEAQSDLDHAVDDLTGCVRGGFSDYLKDYAEQRHKHSKRTQANIVHDLIRVRLTEKLRDKNGWLTRTVLHQLFLVEYKDKYAMRVKKLDRNLCSRNVRTQSVLDFVFQVSQLSLFSDPTGLFLGYQLNEAETEVVAVWITCPDGNKRHWEWELTEAAKVITLPDKLEQREEERGPSVRPKSQPKPATTASDETAD